MFGTFDEKPLGSFHIKTMIVSGIGIFSDAYNLYAIALVYYIASFFLKLNALESSLMTSGAFFGAAIGAIMFGVIADRIGRKPMYGIDLALITVGAFSQFFSSDFSWLLISRIVLGIGIGGDYVLSPVIMAENSNARDRGKLMVFTFPIMAAFGAMLAAFVDQVSSMFLAPAEVWRVVLAFGGFPALLIIYFRRKIPETARYSARVKGDATAVEKIEQMTQSQINIDKDRVKFFKRLRSSLFLVMVSSILWILYDMYASTFSIYGPITIAENLGLTPISFTYYAEVFGGIPGALICAFLIDRVGRRKLIAVGYAGVFIWLLMYSILLIHPAFFGFRYPNGISPAKLAGDAALLGFSFYLLNFLFSAMGPASIIGGAMITPELSPTKVRGTSQAITVGFDRIANALALTAFPLLLLKFGLSTMLLGFSLIAAFSIIVTLMWIPEAKRKTLEEISGEINQRFSTAGSGRK
ncbi:MAG: MFS transporter [Thermoplasmata archaeon]